MTNRLLIMAFLLVLPLPVHAQPSQQLVGSPEVGLGNVHIVTGNELRNFKPGCTLNGVFYAQGSAGYMQNCYSSPPAPGTVVDSINCINNGGQNVVSTICGQNVITTHDALMLKEPLHMTPPYQPDSFKMQCVARGNGTYYWMPDISQVTCQLMKCPAGKVQVCGQELTAQAGTVVGQSARLAIPSVMMPVGYGGPQLSVDAQCVYDNANGAHYQAEDLPLACSDLACPDSHLDLCGISIPLKGGAALGQNFSATLPPPFRPDPYSFSCVGQAGKAPAYMLTNMTQVTCSTP